MSARLTSEVRAEWRASNVNHVHLLDGQSFPERCDICMIFALLDDLDAADQRIADAEQEARQRKIMQAEQQRVIASLHESLANAAQAEAAWDEGVDAAFLGAITRRNAEDVKRSNPHRRGEAVRAKVGDDR